MDGEPPILDEEFNEGEDTGLPASNVDKVVESEEKLNVEVAESPDPNTGNKKLMLQQMLISIRGLSGDISQSSSIQQRNFLEKDEGFNTSKQTAKGPPLEKVEKRRFGPGSYQTQTSYGIEFPCKYCEFSYKNKHTLKSHCYRNHKDEDTKMKRTVDFSKEKKEKKVPVSKVSRQSKTAIEEQPTSTRRANVTLAEACFHCAGSFATKAALTHHVMHDHQDIIRAEQVKKSDPGVIEQLEQSEQQVFSRVMAQSKPREGSVIDNRPASLRRTSLLSNSNGKNRVEKSGLPLSAAIFTRAVQDPNELMIIWTNNLQNDTLVAVSSNPEHATLCIRELRNSIISETMQDIINRGNWFNFSMFGGPNFSMTWTVISFGENNPTFVRDRLYSEFSQVEEAFSEYAKGREMTINNVMRYEKNGLYPLLSQSLVEKITAFI